MIGPHNQESQQKPEQEDESTFTWDEASILL